MNMVARFTAPPRGEPSRLPIAVELLGLPGSGKSALGRALLKQCGENATVVKLRDAVAPLVFARGALRAALPFASQCLRMRSRRWYRYSIMVHLEAHYDAIRLLRGRCELAVLDQGPVYLLSVLKRALREPRSGNAPSFLRYWDRSVDLWARTLQLVVLLDGPDEVLYERIQRRGTPHPLLNRPLQDARQYFERSRRTREGLLELIRSRADGLVVMRIPSDTMEPDETAARVGAFLNVEKDRLLADGEQPGDARERQSRDVAASDGSA
jgi:hypothetical protein